jgi:hypothetical protein
MEAASLADTLSAREVDHAFLIPTAAMEDSGLGDFDSETPGLLASSLSVDLVSWEDLVGQTLDQFWGPSGWGELGLSSWCLALVAAAVACEVAHRWRRPHELDSMLTGECAGPVPV